jgi:hypothetical protein
MGSSGASCTWFRRCTFLAADTDGLCKKSDFAVPPGISLGVKVPDYKQSLRQLTYILLSIVWRRMVYVTMALPRQDSVQGQRMAD